MLGSCVDCGKPHTFTPSLKERGMTSKVAKQIFIDSKGGRCPPCFVSHRSQGAIELIRKIS
jgi:hypothetical protein